MLRIYACVLTATALFLGGCADQEDIDSFFDRTPQEISERVYADSLVIVDSLKLYDESILQPASLAYRTGMVVVLDRGAQELVFIDSERLSRVRAIEVGRGEGPGEVTRGIGDYTLVGGEDAGVALVTESDRKLLLSPTRL